MSTLEQKIPNKENQDRIATALEKIAGSSISDALKSYIDNRVKEKRLEGMPVGYVWVSFSATNPGTIVGGTWSLIEQGRMLLAAGPAYGAGTTGGEATHTLTEAELPNITGSIWNMAYQDTNISMLGAEGVFEPRKINEGHGSGTYTGNNGYDGITMSFGSNQPHNNMPPYISVYMFRRTA